MIPRFRSEILNIPNNELDPSVPSEDNIVVQLQRLFAYLKQSDTAFVSPRDFCHALKDFDGQPTDLLVQQDASEFLTRFFQQVMLYFTCRDNFVSGRRKVNRDNERASTEGLLWRSV